jgi:HD superfamily phosphohydrolase
MPALPVTSWLPTLLHDIGESPFNPCLEHVLVTPDAHSDDSDLQAILISNARVVDKPDLSNPFDKPKNCS